MKKFIIFLVALFFISAIWYSPDNVQVEAGLADRLMSRLASFSEVSNRARLHMDYLEEIKTELSILKFEFHSIPENFNQSGIQGILFTTKFIATVIFDFLSLPIFLLSYVVTFIVDSIIIIFKFFDFFTLFT